MNEKDSFDLRGILRVLKKRRKLIGLTFVLFVLVALAFNLLSPPTYEAITSLRIKQGQSLTGSLLDDLSGGGSSATKQKMSTYAEIIKSRGVVEGVIQKTQQDKEFPPKYEGFVGRITTTPVRDTEILRVLVTGPTPQEAAVVTNTLIKTFIGRMTQMVRAEQTTVREFLAERLKEAVKDLDEAEATLAEYRTKNQVVAPEAETTAIVGRLSSLNTMIAENEVAIATANGRLANVRSQLGTIDTDFLADSPLIVQLKGSIAQKEIEMAGLLQKYTEKYPQVLATRAAIQESKATLATEVARVVAQRSPTTSPVHLGLIQGRIQTEVEIAAAGNKREALRQVLLQSEAELSRLPAKQQGLGRLMRDAATSQEIYAMLTKRHEEARISEVMQTTDAQVLDPAVEPTSPIRPRRALNLAIAAMLGLFTGLGLAFFLEYMNRTIRTAEDVRDYLDIPVLGSIPDFDVMEKTSKGKSTGDFARVMKRINSLLQNGNGHGRKGGK